MNFLAVDIQTRQIPSDTIIHFPDNFALNPLRLLRPYLQNVQISAKLHFVIALQHFETKLCNSAKPARQFAPAMQIFLCLWSMKTMNFERNSII